MCVGHQEVKRRPYRAQMFADAVQAGSAGRPSPSVCGNRPHLQLLHWNWADVKKKVESGCWMLEAGRAGRDTNDDDDTK